MKAIPLIRSDTFPQQETSSNHKKCWALSDNVPSKGQHSTSCPSLNSIYIPNHESPEKSGESSLLARNPVENELFLEEDTIPTNTELTSLASLKPFSSVKEKLLKVGDAPPGGTSKVEFVKLKTCDIKHVLKTINLSSENVSEGSVLREIRCLRELNHPSIPNLYGVSYDPENRLICIRMAQCLGVDGFDFITNGGLDYKDNAFKISLLCGVLEVIKYLNKRGLLYRDLKPENIIIDANSGTVSLVDFGYAATPSEVLNKQALRRVGTLDFAPPESCEMVDIDVNKYDVFSFGVLCFMIMDGNYGSIRLSQFVEAKKTLGKFTEDFVLPDLLPKLESDQYIRDKEIRALILRCLKVDPKERIDVFELDQLMKGLRDKIFGSVAKI